MAIQIITDSGSDIIGNTKPNLHVVPLHVTIGDKTYADGIDINHEEFYERLVEDDTLPVSSQVNPAEFEDAIRPIVEAGDIALIITISSELSGTYQSAKIAADEFDEGSVYIIDSLNVTLSQRCLVEYALRLVDSGMDIESVVADVENKKDHLHVLAMLDTLEYLKKGGRISSTAAIAGNMLQIKPVITAVEGKISLIGAARGSKKAGNRLCEEIEKHGGIDFSMPLYLGYSGLSDVLLQKYIEDSKSLWQGSTTNLPIMTIGCAIGTHAGPGAVAVAFFDKRD